MYYACAGVAKGNVRYLERAWQGRLVAISVSVFPPDFEAAGKDVSKEHTADIAS